MSQDEVPENISYEKIDRDIRNERILLVSGFVFMIFLTILVAVGLSSCTISFQNISTHGTATDLGDEDLTTSPDISPDISVPVSGV